MYKKIKTELKKYEGLSFIERELYIHKEKLLDLYKYGMVLIGPDAFIQNDVLDILAFFENNGFKLVDLRLKQLNRTQTETLFLPTSSCVKCDNLKWWMIQDSAYQGVFCSAIFYCEDAEVTDNCLKMLNELKGKSNPLDNAPGVVRYDYAAINVCLNLIHIPDIYGDFFKDITPFYKISEIIDIINGNFIQYRSLKNKIFEIKLLKKNEMKYTFETVLYKIKFRISCLLEDGEKISDYYMETYEKIQNELNREKRFIFIKKKIIKEDEILERIEKKLIDSIKKVNEIQQIHILIEQMNILHFLKIFTIPRLYKKYERDIFKELEAYGLIVDEFEKLILNTTLIQWRD